MTKVLGSIAMRALLSGGWERESLPCSAHCSPPEELARAPESSSSLSPVFLPDPLTACAKAGLAQNPIKLRVVPGAAWCLEPGLSWLLSVLMD